MTLPEHSMCNQIATSDTGRDDVRGPTVCLACLSSSRSTILVKSCFVTANELTLSVHYLQNVQNWCRHSCQNQVYT